MVDKFRKDKAFNFKIIFAIVLLGLLLRSLFLLIGAKYFFGRENIFVDGDTPVWMDCIVNLIETGTYTMNPNHEYGYFGRTPGYSFYMGFFYLITGKNWSIAIPLIAWSQVILDTLAIYLFYLIGKKVVVNNNDVLALTVASIYAFYPFIIVWNPVVYSESISIFFLIVGFYFFVSNNSIYNTFFTGVFFSLAALCRPQILLILPITGIIIFFIYRNNLVLLLKRVFLYSVAVILVYGSWPIRNYVNHDKIVLTQDLRGWAVADIDWIAFTRYIYSVKAEWQPQFNDIIHNKKVVFPKEAYINTEDSIKLERAIFLAKNCGSSFSNWNGYWKDRITGENCNEEIAKLFNELRENQIKYNKLNFYIYVPFKNLGKALFKMKLYDTNSFARKIGSFLFVLRTLLILFGLLGLYLAIFKFNTNKYSFLLILIFFLAVYVSLCFGTGPQFRNIEMRYFLPADVLLLIPAAFSISTLVNKLNKNV